MPARAGHLAGRDRIAVGEQHRRRLGVGLDADGVDCEHVRPVEKEGDAAKAFRLALGAIGAARAIEARQRRVRLGIAQGHGLDGEGPVRHAQDGQRFLVEPIVVEPERLAVKRKALQHEPFAVEHERPASSVCLRIGPQTKLGLDPGRLRIERKVELDRVHQIIWRSVVLEQLRLPGRLIHLAPPSLSCRS